MTRDRHLRLGEIEVDKPKTAFGRIAEAPRHVRAATRARAEPAGVGPGLAGSLSMFVRASGR